MNHSSESNLQELSLPLATRWQPHEIRFDTAMIKPWGESRTLVLGPAVQVELIQVRRGGFSSPHDHVAKHNLFLVTRGQLQVMIFEWEKERLKQVDRQILMPDHIPFIVDAQQPHQFLCLEDCLAYEVYWPVPGGVLDRNDIRRYGTNGLRNDLGKEIR